jgi:hypothetical protein
MTTSGIPVKNLTPLKLPESAIRKLTPEEVADFRTRIMEMLEQQYTQPVNLQNHPSQQVYATVKDKNGNVLATIYNGGPMSTSNALGGQLKGMPNDGTGPTLAQQRAEWLARKFNGTIEMASTAYTPAQYANVPPLRFQLDEEAMKADTMYQNLIRNDRETMAATTRQALLETQEA